MFPQKLDVNFGPTADDEFELLASKAVQVGERNELREALQNSLDL